MMKTTSNQNIGLANNNAGVINNDEAHEAHLDLLNEVTEQAIGLLETLTKKYFNEACFKVVGTEYPNPNAFQLIKEATANCTDHLGIQQYVYDNIDELTQHDEDSIYLDLNALNDIAENWAELDDDFRETLENAR